MEGKMELHQPLEPLIQAGVVVVVDILLSEISKAQMQAQAALASSSLNTPFPVLQM